MDNNIYPNPRQISLLIVFFFSSFALYFFITGSLPQLLGYHLSDLYIITSLALSSISYLPLIIYFSMKSKVPLKWNVKFPGLKIFLLMALLSITLAVLISPLNNAMHFFNNILSGKLKFLVFRVSEINLNMAIRIIALIVIAPIIEEFFFRKQLLGQLLQKNSPKTAILISSAFFAVGHFRIHELGSLFIWGLFFGIVFYKTKLVETSILLHSFSNLTIILFKSEFHAVTETNLLEYITIMVASFIIICLIIRYITKNDKLKVDFQKK